MSGRAQLTGSGGLQGDEVQQARMLVQAELVLRDAAAKKYAILALNSFALKVRAVRSSSASLSHPRSQGLPSVFYELLSGGKISSLQNISLRGCVRSIALRSSPSSPVRFLCFSF